jgi:hypothetical protein
MNNFNKVLSICFGLILLGACKTEDVKPIINTSNSSLVKIAVDATNISEGGGISQVTVSLNELSASTVVVYFKYTGTATFNADYSSNLSISIAAGSLSNQTTLLALQDIIKEGNETIIISIDSVVGGKIDGVQSKQITIEDDDAVSSGNLIINEVLYDPGDNVAEGDANGDGIRDPNQDEFIEFYNNSSKPLDISGYKIFDATALSSNTPRHIVSAGTILPPNKALVVFGGGNPTGTFGGAIVQKASSGSINMNNAGDLVTVQDSTGFTLLTFDVTPFSDNPNESYTRSPDITGDFVQHGSIDPDKFKFSPGTTVERKPF